MEGNSIAYRNFTVYPEYCGFTAQEILDRSKLDDSYHIGTTLVYSSYYQQIMNIAVVANKGRLVGSRAKHQLYLPTESYLTPGPKPGLTKLDNGENILILICYELVFPEDYVLIKPDLMVHMVGAPMYDENQREGWVALQKSFSITHQCPVICCCGGPEGRMNITGVTLP